MNSRAPVNFISVLVPRDPVIVFLNPSPRVSFVWSWSMRASKRCLHWRFLSYSSTRTTTGGPTKLPQPPLRLAYSFRFPPNQSTVLPLPPLPLRQHQCWVPVCSTLRRQNRPELRRPPSPVPPEVRSVAPRTARNKTGPLSVPRRQRVDQRWADFSVSQPRKIHLRVTTPPSRIPVLHT